MSCLYFQHGKVFSPVIKMYKKSVGGKGVYLCIIMKNEKMSGTY